MADYAKAYSKGYAAGKKSALEVRLSYARSVEEHNDKAGLLRQAFLAALPSVLSLQGWKRGDRPITNLVDRVRLAWETAEEAVKQMPHAARQIRHIDAIEEPKP